ncbi:MAG TPA: bacillithiol biosynthesis cysteine-adding enzyme BshC [Terracidiphilus sp.]|nr:bacillithiol biosynthesis cysteine-adding enzyme BshC [Terracidiphilus sp.]
MPTADCYPMTVAPGLSRLFLDYCAGGAAARAFYTSLPPGKEGQGDWQARPPLPAHWPELVRLLAEQNPASAAGGGAAARALAALGNGAGAVVTGQQVGLFGGPLFTPFKAATAVARARQATAAGHPHAAVFWLASEDHDFAEINHVTFPARNELRKLVYSAAPTAARPVGGIVLDESIVPLIDQAWELLGSSGATEALAAAYQPGRTLAQAFRAFYAKVFAAQGLLVLDAGGREFHRMGSPVLRASLERADELHSALTGRNRELEAADYHAQVAVGPQSSLLFLIDNGTGERGGARMALKRIAPSAAEPDGLWKAGRQNFSTADLVGILDAEPERISPSALLRPVFQDFLLSTSVTVGGPAEVAYFAQSAVLFERILGRATPVVPRFCATLIEPAIGELLRRYELTLERVFAETESSLAQLLAARSMPAEGKSKLAAAGTALDAELTTLLEWMGRLDAGLGRSAETAASKMRYQMNRLRRLAANFQLQREASLGRDAEAICQALYPGGVLQERLHGAAYYFARYGFELAEELVAQAAVAAAACPGHTAMWL